MNQKDQDLFIDSIGNHKNDIAKKMLADNINDLSFEDNYAIKTACDHDNLEIFKLLKEHIDIYSIIGDDDLLYRAAANRSADIFYLLVHDEKIKKNKNDYDLMELIIDNNSFDILETLMEIDFFDFSIKENILIQDSYYSGFTIAQKLLWDCSKVRFSLKKDDPELFEILNALYISDKIENF